MKRRRMQKAGVLAGFLVAIYWISCAEQPNPFGLDEIVSKSSGKVYHFVQYGNLKELSMPYPDIELGTSYELLIGKFRGDQSSMLLKFTSIPDTLDSAVVTRAQLLLEPLYKIKTTGAQPLPFHIHAMLAPWEEENPISPDILTQISQDTMASGELRSYVVSTDTIELNPKYVQEWVLNPDSNHGMAVLPGQADHLAVYYSDDTERNPLLKFWFTRKGKSDSLTIAASQGISILQTDFVIPENRLVVGSGIGYVSFVQVNYDSIPRNSTINKAELSFTVDTLMSIHPSGYIQELTNLKMTESNWSQALTMADSTTRDTTRYQGGYKLNIDLTEILQSWIDGDSPDYGIRLLPLVLDRSIFRTVLYSSSEADTLLRPRLEVFYTTPPIISE